MAEIIQNAGGSARPEVSAWSVNQIALALNNVLGIQNTAPQQALGRLVHETRTDDPAGYSPGRLVWREDRNALLLRVSSPLWLSVLGVRQSVWAPVREDVQIGTGPGAIATVDMVTTGGIVLLLGVASWYGQRDELTEDEVGPPVVDGTWDDMVYVSGSLLRLLDAEGVVTDEGVTLDRVSDSRYSISDQWLQGQLQFGALDPDTTAGTKRYEMRAWRGDTFRTTAIHGVAAGGGYSSGLLALELG